MMKGGVYSVREHQRSERYKKDRERETAGACTGDQGFFD